MRRAAGPAGAGDAAAPAVHSDFGTPERRRHGRLTIDRASGQSAVHRDRARVDLRRPLEEYRRRGLLTEAQFAAGYVLRRLWDDAGMQLRVVMRYEEGRSKGSIENVYLGRGEAGERVRTCLAAVADAEVREDRGRNVRVLRDPDGLSATRKVCIEEDYCGRRAMPALRRSLDRLAAHLQAAACERE